MTGRWVAVVPLGAVSAVVLGLEVFQSRLVAYTVQNVLIYAVIGIALLGFGAAGSLVAVRQEWLQPELLPRAQAWAALSFCASIVGAHALFVRLTTALTHVDLRSLLTAAVLGLPFLAAGTLITLALSGAEVGAAYAANLIGSGLGCFLPLVLLGPLDGEHLLGLFAGLAWAAAVPYVWRVAAPGLALRVASVLTLVLACVSYASARALFPIQPDPPPSGQLAGAYVHAKQVGIDIVKRFDRWNPTGRIEIIELDHVPGGPEPYPAMFYTQDSTAGSSLVQWDGRSKTQVRPSAADPGSFVARMCSETLYSQGYFAPRTHVLVIGLGGGPDLQCALYQEARTVDVVEINRDSISAVRGPLNRWVGGIGSDPRVQFHVRDGRSFVHDRRDQFDLIQLSGVDTKNNLVSGAFALSENHLYTLEAFRDYLASLTADGVLSVIRFGEPEALRLVQTAWIALRERGVVHPERNLAIARTGVAYGVLIRRRPWTESDSLALDHQLHPPYFRGIRIFYYSENGVPFEKPAVTEFLPHFPNANVFSALFDALSDGSIGSRIKLYPWDVSPTSDDRPFFFDIWRYDRAETWRSAHVIALRNLLLSVVALSALLILLPLRRLRAQSGAPRRKSKPLFFACIGLGFIFLEVWLLHRFTTYLGHQIYSVSVVLATLLVTTGLGAAFGGRVVETPVRRACAGCFCGAALTIVLALLLPAVLETTWHAQLPVRALVAAACVTPLGLALGQPFVGGLSWLRAVDAQSIPWCIGINSFFSVIGSVAVIPLLMAIGYSGSLAAAVACYLAAAAFALSMRERS